MIIGIIGGGASGMMAALWACREPTNRVILYERQARLGRKLMATGNGRCNLSNRVAAPSHYHGTDPAFTAPALDAFGVDDTLDYFASLGLLTVEEPDGKLYPFSDQANSVVDVLRLALENSPCELRLGCEIASVTRRKGSFYVSYEGGCDRLDRVIVACGGLAGAQLGGVGSGYAILKSFGHRCTKLYPALVQLRTDRTWVRSLKGVRCDAHVELLCDGNVIAAESGEVQFTDFGISGPCVFSLARACAGRTGEMEAVLDLCPCLGFDELCGRLSDRVGRFPDLSLENFLTGLLHNRLGRMVVKYASLGGRKLDSLTDDELMRAAESCKDFCIELLGVEGFDFAQVTAGGIKTSGVNPETLESWFVPNLYICGELLDIDADCGGFNLQWAWASGHLAGRLGK